MFLFPTLHCNLTSNSNNLISRNLVQWNHPSMQHNHFSGFEFLFLRFSDFILASTVYLCIYLSIGWHWEFRCVCVCVWRLLWVLLLLCCRALKVRMSVFMWQCDLWFTSSCCLVFYLQIFYCQSDPRAAAAGSLLLPAGTNWDPGKDSNFFEVFPGK